MLLLAALVACKGTHKKVEISASEFLHQNELLPKLIILVDQNDPRSYKQCSKWAERLTKALKSQAAPVLLTNDTSNQALWSVLGIDKAIDLPSALLVMPGKLGDAATKMYKYKSSWDYDGLLRLGTHFALTSIQEPPEEFDEDDFRIPESSNFYYQCVKPADARCVVFLFERGGSKKEIKQFKNVVMNFRSMQAKFRFMIGAAEQYKTVFQFKLPTENFPQMIVVDPKDKLFAPLEIESVKASQLRDQLLEFDKTAGIDGKAHATNAPNQYTPEEDEELYSPYEKVDNFEPGREEL